MSKSEVKAFIDYRDLVQVTNDVKVHGRVKVRDRVRVKGRVQAHGHVKTSVSGNVVIISGQVVNISGQFVSAVAPTLLRNGYSQITHTSGGVQLSSGVVIFVTVESIPGNDPIWIGNAGVNSGTGYLLVAGNNIDISIDNLNKVWLFAQTSGQFVSWLAED